jgi:hypothetical protein
MSNSQLSIETWQEIRSYCIIINVQLPAGYSNLAGISIILHDNTKQSQTGYSNMTGYTILLHA